jgi:single-strand DNA-binding protein
LNFIGVKTGTLKNSTQLRNDLAEDPELVNLNSRKKLAKSSITTNAYHHGTSGKKVTNTYWHNIIAWGKTDSFTETCVKKGQVVLLKAKIAPHSYDARDGEKHNITKINCSEMVDLAEGLSLSLLKLKTPCFE